MGGKFNSRLKDNKVGWVFPKTFEQQVKDYVSSGKITVKVKPNSSNSSVDQKRLEEKIDNLDKKLDVVMSLLKQIIGKPIESNNSGKNEKRRLLRRM